VILSGKYEVTEKVGQGGMGIVYRVRHLDLDTVLALKILPRELSQDPDLVERFRREARMMARLNHANIVRVFDFAKDGDTYYLIMEFLAGRNLRQVLQERLERTRKAMPLPEVLRVGAQIAEALAYAHEQKPAVVHRDIKPSNIIIEEGSERAVVTDFGIAKLMGESQSELTHTGLFVGTVKYCAPEQLRHDADIDARVDVYALGMLLYELYTGKQYFAGLKDHEVIGKVLYEQGENLVDLPDTPPEVNALMTRAMARDRDTRHPSAEALLGDLQACLRGIGEGGDPGTSATATAGGADEIEAQIRALERVRMQRLAEEARDACQAAHAAAERDGAEAEAGETFAAAVVAEDEGLGLLAGGQHEDAARRLGEAAAAFREAAAGASRQRAERGVARAREAARDLKQQAEEAGASATAPEALARADALVATAEQLATEGEYDRATAEFGEAAEAYGAVIGDVRRAEDLRVLQAALPDIRAARQRAEEAKAPELAPDAFTTAVQEQARFEEALAAEQLTAAQEIVGLVQPAFDAAVEGARTAHLREEARAAQAAMETQRAAAEAAIGDREPPAEMASAAARAGEAAEVERDGDWGTACAAYGEAAKLYEQAAERGRAEAEGARVEGDLAEARATCDAAKASATEAGASKGAPTLFARARDLAKKAAKQAKGDAAVEATDTYRQAADQYTQAKQVAERRAQRVTLEQALAAAATARADAEKAGGQTSERFAEAERATAEATRALESDDLTSGARSAEVARQAYEGASQDAALELHLGEADAALATAASRRDEAQQAGAEVASARAQTEASRLYEQAVAARSANDWQESLRLAGEAAEAFAGTLTAAVDAAHADAVAAEEAASAAGVADDEVEEASATLRSAGEQRAAGRHVAAAKAFREAAAGFRAATDRTGGAASEARASAEAARRVAEEADAATHAADVFGQATAAFAQGEREANDQRFSLAVAGFREAGTLFESATGAATDARSSAASAEARAAAGREREAAAAAGAAEYVAADYEAAERDYQDGEAAVAEEDFVAAEAAFQSAAAAFRVVVVASERVRAEREAKALRDQARALRALRDPEREARGVRRKIKKADAALDKGDRLLESGGDLAKVQAEFARAVQTLEALPAPPESEDATSMATVVRSAPSATRSIPWLPIGGALVLAILVAGWLALRPAGSPAPEQIATGSEPGADARPATETETGAGEQPSAEAEPALGTEPPSERAADTERVADTEEEPEQKEEPEQEGDSPVQVAAVEPEPEPPAPEPTPPPAPRIKRVEPDEAAVQLEAGSKAAFRVELADASDVSYEWKVGGKVVSDADSATFRVSVPDKPSTVVVVAKNAGGAVEHQWELAALPRATEVAPPPLKAPEIVKAAPRGRSLALDVGKSQRFSVEVASADDSLTWAWSVDGRNVGRERAYTLAPKDADEGETRRVQVSVADSKGKKVTREWAVNVPTTPISIVGQRPANDAKYPIGASAELSVEARVGSRRDVPLEYRWSVDGKRIASASGPSLRHEIENTQTQIEVVVDAPGRQAAVRRWRLRGDKPVVPEPTVDSEGEIRAWIEAYRSAYERKDVDRMVALGVLGAGNRDRMKRILGDLDGLSVKIVNRSIDVKGPDRAVVSLTRVDSFSAGRGREEKSIPITKTLRKRNGLWVAE